MVICKKTQRSRGNGQLSYELHCEEEALILVVSMSRRMGYPQISSEYSENNTPGELAPITRPMLSTTTPVFKDLRGDGVHERRNKQIFRWRRRMVGSEGY